MVFEGISSPTIAEAMEVARGTVECVVLTHAYRHLSPVVAEAPSPPAPVGEGLRREGSLPKRGPHALNPRPQPPAEETLSIREQCERDWHRLNESAGSYAVSRATARDCVGRRSVPPLSCGSTSRGTEPRRERPRFWRASATPRAPQGSFTSRFRVPIIGVDVGGTVSDRAGRRAACLCARFSRRRRARSWPRNMLNSRRFPSVVRQLDRLSGVVLLSAQYPSRFCAAASARCRARRGMERSSRDRLHGGIACGNPSAELRRSPNLPGGRRRHEA